MAKKRRQLNTSMGDLRKQRKMTDEEIYEVVRYGTPENFPEYAERFGLTTNYLRAMAKRVIGHNMRFDPTVIRAWKDRKEAGESL
jgi:hypothetical protein